MKKSAFTLSELMIALTVLGILCAILLPAIVRTMPNQNKVMMKRAYYTTANIVSDMINDANLYPSVDSSGNTKVGFDNLESVTYNGKTYSSYSKFISLFAAHLNIDGEINETCSGSGSGATIPGNSKYCRIFTTPDGILWTLKATNSIEMLTRTNTITVDVNGDKKPNCMQGDDSCSTRTSNFDRFSMEISDDGTITIPEEQTWAREALQVSSSLTE